MMVLYIKSISKRKINMKNTIIKIILLTGLLLPQILNAELNGIGYGQTHKEAKKEALSDLSQLIKCEVRSFSESQTIVNSRKSKNDDVDKKFISSIKVSSNLPLLGVEFSNIQRSLEVEVNAKLNPKKVKKLYTKKMQNIKIEITAILKEIKKTNSNSLKLSLYEELYSLLTNYDRYESVAIIIDAKLENRPQITKVEVKSKIAIIYSNIDSLNIATTILAKKFQMKDIYVYPPLMQYNSTVSEFGALFLKKLKEKINTTKNLKNAKYILVGEYTLSKKYMVLNYELLNTTTKEVISSKTITIQKKAYKNIKVKPNGVDFNTLLNSGIAQSSALRVSLNSNRGNENLLFEDGDEVELFVKLNKMGYLYIVGYTQTQEGKMSYLLELNEGMGNSKFLKFINADDASRWISLGIFNVEPPFGIESLQVIASNKKMKSLPNVNYNNENGYYIISSNIKNALLKTRGLRPKKIKK